LSRPAVLAGTFGVAGTPLLGETAELTAFAVVETVRFDESAALTTEFARLPSLLEFVSPQPLIKPAAKKAKIIKLFRFIFIRLNKS
jgi:hypothetical protein